MKRVKGIKIICEGCGQEMSILAGHPEEDPAEPYCAHCMTQGCPLGYGKNSIRFVKLHDDLLDLAEYLILEKYEEDDWQRIKDFDKWVKKVKKEIWEYFRSIY